MVYLLTNQTFMIEMLVLKFRFPSCLDDKERLIGKDSIVGQYFSEKSFWIMMKK